MPSSKQARTANLILLCYVQETRYRQRYLDGIVNHETVRRIFTTRAKVIQKIRRFFDERDFMEVLCPFPQSRAFKLFPGAAVAMTPLVSFPPLRQ